jgi:hypothetical protein
MAYMGLETQLTWNLAGIAGFCCCRVAGGVATSVVIVARYAGGVGWLVVAIVLPGRNW